MEKNYKSRIVILACIVVLLFGVIASLGLHFSSQYIQNQLLKSNQDDVVDIATLVGHNFSITNEEVAYMKTLTFDEMETDPINQRLMDTVSGLSLKNRISNIYVMCFLQDDEIKYTVDEEMAEELQYSVGTKLNGIWLLNGKFDDDGNFVPTSRKDYNRYLEFCNGDKKVFESKKSFGLVSEDVWGKFITGYVPLYSEEGNYIGILGVDMDMNIYNSNVTNVTSILFSVYIIIILILIALFALFFVKYEKTKEGVLYYEFYSRLSHDLRTPMNGILGIANLSKSENDPNALHKDIAKMESAGQYLLSLINDTLDFQKMHSKKLVLHKEVINVKEQLEQVINMVDQTAKQKGVNFETNVLSAPVLEYVVADPMRLNQIFINLLSNAVKFTPSGGTVKLEVKFLSREDNKDSCLITVEDTGIGMSEKFISNELFKPFSQEYNSITTQYSGSGLGLSIVKNLVKEMGGKIEVESKQGKGTTFRVYLDFEPVKKEELPETIAVSSKEEENVNFENKKILLVEDHSLNAEIAKRLLQKEGFEVTWVVNGQEAVSHFAASPDHAYDIILMDIRMPVMDGLEATREIRALDKEDAKEIPIIAMTANAYDEDIRECSLAGMNAHIAKPIDPNILYATLSKYLREKK